ncbi:hypothetical protein Tco_0179194 [Tanacetum coccineum]
MGGVCTSLVGRTIGLEYGRYGLEYGVLPSSRYGVLDLVSFVVFGECRHRYAVSSLMDMAYWLSEQILRFKAGNPVKEIFQMNLPDHRYQDYQDKDYQGTLLSSFQDDSKYEHIGKDTRSQDGKDDKDLKEKDLKIFELKTKSKDNDKGSRSEITQYEGTSLQQRPRPRPGFKSLTTRQSQRAQSLKGSMTLL